MSEYPGTADYAPEYASYNWTGAPANFELSTNAVGGDSRMSASKLSSRHFTDGVQDSKI
jgi:hypothetical protein